MNILKFLLILIILQQCSFDNKSGIWQNKNDIQKKDNVFKDFEKLSTTKDFFNEKIEIEKNYSINLSKNIVNKQWKDIYYNNSNNYNNFKYENLNKLILKSKKFSKYNINKYKLYENDNIILSDDNGNLFIFSINEKRVIRKFNFYKNKFKKIKKKINFLVENGIIFVSDNLGYLYAIDYKKDKVIWAKNYKIPFRSNLKLYQNTLIAANQNNGLFFFNKTNGDLIKKIPTEETLVKNEFINSLSISKNNLFFLNTYGSLYSININSMSVEWFLNINQSLDLNQSNLFVGKEIINYKGKLVTSSNNFTYIFDEKSGSLLYKKNFISSVKPILNNSHLFLITENNFLICLNLKNKKIVYSYDINRKIAEFLNLKKKKVEPQSIFLVNNKIFIFLKNNYLIIFNINGELEEVRKLPSKIHSTPIFINNSIFYLDQKNRLLALN